MEKFELTSERFQRIARAISDPNRWEILQTVFKEPEVTCGQYQSFYRSRPAQHPTICAS